ncbi:MAG: hypothetical protein OXC95_10200 [Dehalococcoidia bacterium]|nr:hypothetical protein [Dehalococcoidia bacterium]
MKDKHSERESFWLRLLLRALRPPAADDRESVWAVSRKWLPFYIGLISVMTFCWMWVEAHAKWAEWHRRFKEAEARGLPFDEPPPELPSDPGRNGSDANGGG